MKKFLAVLGAVLVLTTGAGAIEVSAPSALLMEKETGRRRSMVLRDPADSAEPEGGNRDEKLRDLAKGASEILGVDVDVR